MQDDHHKVIGLRLILNYFETNLQPAIKRPRNSDTLGGRAGTRQRSLQLLDGAFPFLQLLHQAVYCLLRPFLFFVALGRVVNNGKNKYSLNEVHARLGGMMRYRGATL